MKIQHHVIYIALAAVILSIEPMATHAASAPVSGGSFTIGGDVHDPGTWSAERIQSELKAKIQTVHYVLKGQGHTAHVVPLLALIDGAHPSVNPNIKHHDLQFMIVVRGFDGYAVDFIMAELLPSIGNRSAWIALDEDGKPLSEEGGALQILVPGDVKPARWVHSIIAITILDGAKLSMIG